tara:strand:+ start:199 stop:678 length:480 start_codon:yes stop_codon:yes gene_type:complete
MKDDREIYISRAVELATKSAGQGTGPFGALIVFGGQVVAEAHNSVTSLNDPTAHAEILTIRRAAQKLKSFDLSECELYTSSYPCPMCLGAIMWAKIGKVYYANDLQMAEKAGFADVSIKQAICAEHDHIAKKLDIMKLSISKSEEPFQEWERNDEKIPY